MPPFFSLFLSLSATCVIFKSERRREERCGRKRKIDAGGAWAEDKWRVEKKDEDERMRWEARRCHFRRGGGEKEKQKEKQRESFSRMSSAVTCMDVCCRDEKEE